MGADDGKAGAENLTPRQKRWFATVRANLEAQTGKPIEAWVAIARTCPHSRPRARTQWLKEAHGLGVNHAAYVLSEAFPGELGWDDEAALRAALWKDPASAAILRAIEAAAAGLDDLVVGQRKGYTAFSRDVQFAATRPLKGGRALLGLKLDPSASPRLSPSLRKESWSERLGAVLEFDGAAEVDDEVCGLIAAAHRNG
jgi:hypothetical protein